MSSNVKRRKRRDFNWFYVVLFALLVVYLISLFIPVFWTIMTSVKTNVDYTMYQNVLGWPKEITFKNYATAYQYFRIEVVDSNGVTRDFYMMDLFINSILYSLGCAIAATITPCIVAYLVARYKYKFGKVVYAIVIITMALPIVGALPSEILVARSLGLFDHFYGLWIMKANFLGVYFLVFFAQFKTLPMAYTEAARVDGAGNFKIMGRIIFPFVSGTIFTVFLLNFIMFWNDYQIPMIYLPSHPVAAYGMYIFQTSAINQIANTPTRLAGIMLMTLPIVLVAVIFSRKLMANLNVGGIKE